jgi:hypothetical protein
LSYGYYLLSREADEDRKKLQRELALTKKKCELLFSRIDAKVGWAILLTHFIYRIFYHTLI